MTLYQKFLESKGACIDTRKIGDGEMFFALKGPNFDANEFAEEALAKGAKYAVVDQPKFKHSSQTGIIYVDDVLKSMQDLAKYHRTKLKSKVIALTGSNGKTTTKELLNVVLSKKFKTHATAGNFNNLIGLPLTLLNCPADAEMVILEMGANHIGEIKDLCSIGQPHYGLITNIGKAHFEGFLNLEGVKKAKSELYEYLSENNGVAFINVNEAHLNELSRNIKNRVFYSTDEQGIPEGVVPIVQTQLIRKHPYLSLNYAGKSGNTLRVDTQLPGTYNYPNIATAIAVGLYFELTDDQIKTGLREYQPKINRSQWLDKAGNQFFLDAYNANPSSMRVSVSYFLENAPQPRILILGDMLELGKDSYKEHRDLLNDLLVKREKFEHLWLVGKEFSIAMTTKDEALHFPNATEVKKHLESEGLTGYHIFLKGSRGIALEKIVL